MFVKAKNVSNKGCRTEMLCPMNISHKSCCSKYLEERMFEQRHLINRKFGGKIKQTLQKFYTMRILYFISSSLKGRVLPGVN
jgi:hypothetical protein